MLRNFDLFPVVPKDFSEKTSTGGCFTVLLFLSLCWLIISEVMDFMRTEIISEVIVEDPSYNSHMVEMLSVHFNMSFPNCACHVLSVETQDTLGGFSTDLGTGGILTNEDGQFEAEIKKLFEEDSSEMLKKSMNKPYEHKTRRLNKPYVHKTRILPGGEKVKFVKDATLDDMPSKIIEFKGEGCEIRAFLYARKIPGNLHVTTYAFENLAKILYQNPPDLSHTIESFEFGNTDPELHTHSSSFAPLDKYVSMRPRSYKSGESVSFEYYLKVVPTRYIKGQSDSFREGASFSGSQGRGLRAWQFTASANTNSGRYNSAGIYFRYDFSPMTVVYSQKSESLTRFIAQLLGIIGAYISLAVFCVFICHKSLSRLLFKEVGGKLG